MSAATVTAARALVGAATFSRDPRRIVAFHERVLGLRYEHRLHADGREHWICDLDGIHLEVKALVTADGAPTPDAAAGAASTTELSYRVDDVQAAVAGALEADPDAALLMPVERHSWGTFGVVLDPDGNRLGLYAPPTEDEDAV